MCLNNLQKIEEKFFLANLFISFQKSNNNHNSVPCHLSNLYDSDNFQFRYQASILVCQTDNFQFRFINPMQLISELFKLVE